MPNASRSARRNQHRYIPNAGTQTPINNYFYGYSMKIVLIGGGNMGKTYAHSFIASQTVKRANLFILERLEEKIPLFHAQGFMQTYTQPGPFLADMDLLLLAVKPQDFADLAPRIATHLTPGQTVLSIMAGIKMEAIAASLGCAKVVRAMPNLPAQVGMGMTAFTSTQAVGKEELLYIQNLLNTTGKTLYFADEALLDAVTAISGSGPAYVYYFMAAMIEQARTMGFEPAQAEMLVEQTFLGAIMLLQREDLTCQEWIGRVASKGGTTEAALTEFELKHTAEGIKSGLQMALERARELGK